ncbi:MAG: hypothetical protein A2Z16_00065 [Chloroflexi bacterium RBG_16_54_18]|nr:MAG: hypothetical protein A2Z16_00065 [Chloroflexi bacterium RBG_16_54_18]
MLRNLMNTSRTRFWGLPLILLLVISACEMPLTAPTPTLYSVQQATTGAPASDPPASTAEPPVQVFLPDIDKSPTDNSPTATESGETTPQDSAGRLAFLKNGDLWLVELPQLEPRRLTSSSDLQTFAWSPDASRIATFNGRSLCYVDLAGEQTSECLGLGLTEEQSIIPRGIVWSPDQKTIVLWNLANPWDDQALGWLVVHLDAPQDVLRIADPLEYGYMLEKEQVPGGFTGQPLFLKDGTLVGTLSHREECGSGGCRYQLYTFDPAQRKFSPYPNNPEEGWSEGQNLVLSPDGGLLANFGTFFSECDSYITFADTFDLNSGQRKAFNLELEAITSLDFSQEATQAVIARVSGCASPPEQSTWDRSCGLSQGFDTFPLQVWDLENGGREDYFPGVSPDWSSGKDLIAFRSCLAESASGIYEPTSTGPPSIYVLVLATGDLLQIGEGLNPAWSPK